MKTKTEYVVLATVIILLAIYLVLRPSGPDPDRLPQPQPVDEAAINRLVITDKHGTGIELVKKDERWFIQPHGYPGNTATVRNMARAAADLTLTALVSESGNYERYGLGPSDQIHVQAFSNGNPVRAFHIGRTAPTHQHTFVLLAGNPNVYHARGTIARTFDHTVDSLRDKTVFDFDESIVTVMAIQRGEQSAVLTQEPIEDRGKTPEARDPGIPTSKEWRDGAGNAVDQEAVTQLLNTMARMDCDGYMDDQASERLTDARWSVTFETLEGDFTLLVFPKENEEDNEVPAMASTTPYAFFLNEDRVQRMETSLNALLGDIHTP